MSYTKDSKVVINKRLQSVSDFYSVMGNTVLKKLSVQLKI